MDGAGGCSVLLVRGHRAAVQVGSTVAATTRDPLWNRAHSRVSALGLAPPLCGRGADRVLPVAPGRRAANGRVGEAPMPEMPGYCGSRFRLRVAVGRCRWRVRFSVYNFTYSTLLSTQIYILIPANTWKLDRDPSFYLILNLVWPAGGGPSATLPCPS